MKDSRIGEKFAWATDKRGFWGFLGDDYRAYEYNGRTRRNSKKTFAAYSFTEYELNPEKGIYYEVDRNCVHSGYAMRRIDGRTIKTRF